MRSMESGRFPASAHTAAIGAPRAKLWAEVARVWRQFLSLMFAALLIAGATSAYAKSLDHVNLVHALFAKAEIQFETEAQGKILEAVLTDLLARPAAELKRKRYPNYTGEPDQWSATQVIAHYFVPRTPVALDENTFYDEIRSPDSRRDISRQLQALTAMMKNY